MTNLSVLIIEDSEDDTLLLVRELEQHGFQVDVRRVETAGAMEKALAERPWDVILADYTLPSFSGADALLLLKKSRLDIPFIIVSGTIDEEAAVTFLKAGAQDYINKSRLARLATAVGREVKEAAERRARRIAEQERSRSMLREQAARGEAQIAQGLFRDMLESAPDAILLVDQQGRIVILNSQTERMFGYARSELQGKGFGMLVPEQDSHPLLLPGERRDKREELALRKDGSTFPIELCVSPLTRPDGADSIVILRDLSERKQAAELIASKERELHEARELQDLKNTFVSMVSHELRNPITSVMGYAEFLEDELAGPLNGQQVDYVRQIRYSARTLASLVDDLLDFARMDAGTFRLNLEESDFRDKVCEVVANLKPQAEAAQLSLDAELPDEELCLVMDPQRIGQVLLNLLSNAIKFTKPGGSVRVRAAIAGGRLRCEVIDTGIGIAPADLELLFQRFVQLQAGKRRGGTGLGLSISKALVLAHGGEIGAQSDPGKGSTFWFALPLSPPKQSARGFELPSAAEHDS